MAPLDLLVSEETPCCDDISDDVWLDKCNHIDLPVHLCGKHCEVQTKLEISISISPINQNISQP